MSTNLKPDIEIATKAIERDYHLRFVLCLAVIVVAVASFIQDWAYKSVFAVMAIVSFVMLGSKKDIPDESWSPQQKGAWTKRYTTLKSKDGKLIYITGNSPSDKESYELSNIDCLKYEGNKLFVIIDGEVKRKISTKYWPPEKTQKFVLQVNDEIIKTHNKWLKNEARQSRLS